MSEIPSDFKYVSIDYLRLRALANSGDTAISATSTRGDSGGRYMLGYANCGILLAYFWTRYHVLHFYIPDLNSNAL